MNSIKAIISRRVLNALITILLVLILNFFLFRMMPGDPIKMFIPNNPKIPEEYIQKLIQDYGLDQPWYTQFFTYLKNVWFLDFGDSINKPGTPAIDLVLSDMKWTLILTGTSAFFMIIAGITIGIVAAWKRGGMFDTGSLAFSLFFYAMPTFWFGMMLIVIFSTELQIFPPGDALTYGETLEPTLACVLDLLDHLVLPAISLTLGSIAAFSLIMRGSLIDVMTEDYIITARAKGLRESSVLKNHAVPNAMLPMVTLLAMEIAFVVGGAFQAEIVFEYPGIGLATVTATENKDYPILQCAFFIIALAVILANLVADILLIYLDPRVKMG